MSNLELDVLRILRIFGPCSNAEVGRRLQIGGDRTYRAIGRLVQKGLATHPKLQEWRITANGILAFQDSPNKVLALHSPIARREHD